MFEGLSSITALDIQRFNTTNATDISNMFTNCSELVTIEVGNTFTFENSTTGDNMFVGCTKLEGGAHTQYSNTHVDKEYARIDTTTTPGYFTCELEVNTIEISQVPTKNSYKFGDTFDPTNLSIKLNYTISPLYDIVTYADNESDFQFTNLPSNWNLTDQTYVTIKYKNYDTKTVNFNITVKNIDKIKVDNLPGESLRKYKKGEKLNPSGLRIKLKYVGDEEYSTTVAYNNEPTNFRFNGTVASESVLNTVNNDFNINVTYLGRQVLNSSEGTPTYQVCVYELSSVTLATRSAVYKYRTGEKFKPAGLQVNENYSDGTVKLISYNTRPGRFEFNPNTDTQLTPGITDINIIYTDEDSRQWPLTTPIEMVVVDTIEVKVPQNKRKYIKSRNEAYKPQGLILKLNYTDGSDGELTYTTENANEFSFNPSTTTPFTTVGNNIVTITWDGKQTTTTVQVLENDDWDVSKQWYDAYMYTKVGDTNNVYISNEEYVGSDLGVIYRYHYNVNTNYSDHWATKTGAALQFYNATTNPNGIRQNTSKAIVVAPVKIPNYTNFFGQASNSNGPNFINFEGLDKIDTSEAVSLEYMFGSSKAGITLDLSNWDTSNVTNMHGTFIHSEFTSINLMSWNTSNVTNTKFMFGDSNSALTKIYVDPDLWNMSNVTTVNSDSMFNNTSGLKGQNNFSYNSSYQDKTYAVVDKEEGPRGYLSTLKSYEITFNNGNNIDITNPKATISCLWGLSVPEQSNPTDPNYIFHGYYANPELTTPYNWNQKIYEDTTIYLKWNIIYDVTFISDGLYTGTLPVKQRIENGTKSTRPANLSQTGYQFEYWYYNDINTAFDFENTNITDNTQLTAKWVELSYAINYHTPGSGWNWDTSFTPITSRLFTESYNLKNETVNKVIKEGHTFNDWYESTTFSGNPVLTLPANSTKVWNLYPKFTMNSYPIIFYENGGEWVSGYTKPANRLYNEAKSLPTSTNIKKIGWRFDGWFKDSGLNNGPYTVTDMNSTETLTYYAKWTEIENNIYYQLNEGSWVDGSDPTSKNRTRKYADGDINLQADNTIQKTGHTFRGWYDNSQLTGEKWTKVSRDITVDKTFYAKWEVNRYQITWHKEVATSSTSGSAGTATWRSGEINYYTYGQTTTLSSDIIFNGYIFRGWYDNPNFTGSAITQITPTDIGPKEYWSLWEQVPTYTLSFNANGGSGNMNPVVITEGVQTVIPGCSFSKNSYSFNGWKDSNGTSYPVGNRYLFDHDITLIAQWTYVKPYNPSRGGGGGSGGGGGGGGIPAGNLPNQLNPLGGGVQTDTPEIVADKYNHSPVAIGTFKIIKSDGKSSNLLDNSLEASTTNFKWQVDPLTNQYLMYSINQEGKVELLTGWALVEYKGVYRYYRFNPVNGQMTKGFYTDPTTGKTYFFEYNQNSDDFGSMCVNTTKEMNGYKFTFNEKGELVNQVKVEG